MLTVMIVANVILFFVILALVVEVKSVYDRQERLEYRMTLVDREMEIMQAEIDQKREYDDNALFRLVFAGLCSASIKTLNYYLDKMVKYNKIKKK